MRKPFRLIYAAKPVSSTQIEVVLWSFVARVSFLCVYLVALTREFMCEMCARLNLFHIKLAQYLARSLS